MSEQAKPLDVVKVTMKGPKKRIAYLRTMTIKDTQLAAKALGQRKLNQIEMQLAMQAELLKLLLIQIDDQRLDHKDKNNLDSILSIAEYRCLLKVVEQMAGEDDDEGEPETEITTL